MNDILSSPASYQKVASILMILVIAATRANKMDDNKHYLSLQKELVKRSYNFDNVGIKTISKENVGDKECS